MKKRLQTTISKLLVVCCLLCVCSFRAHAASGKITFNDPTVTVGDSVTVKMTVSAADCQLGWVEVVMSYDSSLLEYTGFSGSSGVDVSGGGGSIHLVWVLSGDGASSINCSFSFKTLKTGSCTIEPSAVDVLSADEEGVTMTSYGSSVVTVNAKPTASAEARLSSLKVGSASLSPKFSSDTYEYSATVAAGTKKAVISLSTVDSKATYSISDTSLKVGANTVTIKVKAEDGTTKTYTIKITRPPDPETEQPDEPEGPTEPEEPVEEPVTVVVDGVTYHVARTLEGVTLPEGFEESAYTYQETEIAVAKGLGKPLTLFWLTDENGENGAFYIYDETASACYRYRDVTSGQKIYALIALPAQEVIPEGYMESTVTIGEESVTAWVSDQSGEMVLLYAMNWDGQTGFYRYDTVEQTMQRYVSETAAVVEQEPEDTVDEEKQLLLSQNQELYRSLEEADTQLHKSKLLIFALLAVAAVLVILIICVLIFTNVRQKKERTEPERQVSRPAESPKPGAVKAPTPVTPPAKPPVGNAPQTEDDVDLSKLGLGDVDLSTVDVDDIDFDFDF